MIIHNGSIFQPKHGSHWLISLAGMVLSVSAQSAPVENFGQNTARLQQAFAQKKLHIVQMGDSHTAADYFTDQLRKRLQADLGDGGIGFAYPMPINGQRTARHGYQNDNWQLSNSRSMSGQDYPLGGVVGTSGGEYTSLTLTSQTYANDTQAARIIAKGQVGDVLTINDATGKRQFTFKQNGWQTLPARISFPATFSGKYGLALGGFWLDRPTGGTVSALGINGATQDYWLRWHQPLTQDLAHSQADLVILAYGTNEAFDPDPSGQGAAIDYAIGQIRQALPNAAILLVNAPDSLQKTTGRCGTRAPHLDQAQATIRQRAQQHRTLYWSWQQAMGGECSMKRWIEQGLGRSDGVHFTKPGYEQAADDLYDNLKIALGIGGGMPTESRFLSSNQALASDRSFGSAGNFRISEAVSQPTTLTPTSTAPARPTTKGKICDAKGRCTVF